MGRDETVCKYCGVSYLILHEYKLMEEKVKAMEKEMEFYRGSVEREKRLQAELDALSKQFEQSEADRRFQEERIHNLTTQLKKQQDDLQIVLDSRNFLEEQLKAATSQSELFRARMRQQHLHLNKAVPFLHFAKSELAKVKKEVLNIIENWAAMKSELFVTVEGAIKAAQKEYRNLDDRLSGSQDENLRLREQVKQLQLLADSSTLTKQQLQVSLQNENKLQIRCEELQIETLGLQNQLKRSVSHVQTATREMEHHRDMFVMKSKENEELQATLKHMEFDTENSESRLIGAIREKEALLMDFHQKCNHLLAELADKKTAEETLVRRISCSDKELEVMKTIAKQAEEEVAVLKRERESLMIAHQNRMEQLQDSFRLKALNGESWREKLESELNKERGQHTLKLNELTFRLKQEAKIALDIEKQRHQELIDMYQKEQEETQMKIPIMISNTRKEQQAEIEFLEKKLQEAQSKLTEKDKAKDNEIQSLKTIVTELQLRLKHEQNNGFSLTEELKKEYNQKSADLKRVTEEHNDLMQHFTQVQEQNTFLQETVRRECEERFELTEALTVAREQLLQLKKIDGNLPSSTALSNQTIPSVLARNNRQKHFTGPVTGKDAKHKGLHGELGPVSASSAPEHRIGFSTLPSLHPPRGRASSVNEARKRITAILRQSSSQH